MPNNRQKNYMIDFIFTLSLFGVFAVSALLVVVIGANVYRSTVNMQEANAIKRTSLAYVAEKIHQNDASGNIFIGEIEGVPALVLNSVYNDETYSTYIYTDQGFLKELFIKSSDEPTLMAGQTITEIRDFSVEQVSDSLYYVTSTDMDGKSLSLHVSTHSS